jgi:FkbM family methyltransferase
MLLNLHDLKQKYNMNLKGVIHVGAHYGEECALYESLSIDNKLFFDPSSRNFEILSKNIEDASLLVKKAVGNENKKIVLNIETANNGQSNSILNLKLHLSQYPHITFNSTEEVDMIRLDDYIENPSLYNFLNIDVQGYELEVLKGSEKLLNHVDYIISEINKEEVYENCALVGELIQYLESYRFKLVEQSWDGGSWGDGLFIL